MSDTSTLEKIKEAEEKYAADVAEAKLEAERIIKRAKAEAEIIIHDANERELESSDGMKVEAMKTAKAKYDETIKSQEESIAKLKQIKKDYVMKGFSESIAEIFKL